ncbi:MAG TPA: hypothetical protein PKV73_01370 [Agriterribacter sp.]|nr:hypothetical protein [Agriterribacter sp.]
MRLTEDGVYVLEGEFVWEIVYRYYNFECSLPEAETREVREIPSWARIWKHKSNCLKECAILEEKMKMDKRKMPPIKVAQSKF